MACSELGCVYCEVILILLSSFWGKYTLKCHQICFFNSLPKFFLPLSQKKISNEVFSCVSNSMNWKITNKQTNKQHNTYKNMFRYGTVWPLMVLYGPVWSSMIPYGPVWSCMILYGPVYSCMFPYSPIWSTLFPYGPLSSPMVPCGSVWSLYTISRLQIKICLQPMKVSYKLTKITGSDGAGLVTCW